MVLFELLVVEEEEKPVLFVVSPENYKTIVGLKASGISIGDVRLSICDARVVIVFAPAVVSLLCN